MTAGEPTRRDMLEKTASAAVVGLAGCVGSLGGNSTLHNVAHRDVFDDADARFHEDGGLLDRTNDSESTGWSGLLAWGESYVLRAYLLMYRAYRDTDYLDKFVEHADAVLDNRDSERGVTDYHGLSLPAWRADAPYTIGQIALSDDTGSPTLEVRSAASYANRSNVTITSESGADTFSLRVHNWDQNRTTSYADLSMDPDSPNYVETRINREGFEEDYPDGCLVTVADLRDAPEDAGVPASGTFEPYSPHYVFAVHTGMITFPLVRFTRLVEEVPELQEDSTYASHAEEYLEAAREAVAVHDPMWRETEQGGGFYAFKPGSPTFDESNDLPHNQMLALGRTLTQLAAVTGESSYTDRVYKLAETFRNDLQVDDSDAYIWSYHWSEGRVARGWSAENPESEYRPWAPGMENPATERPEDVNHGHIDVEFAALLSNNRDLFGERDRLFTPSDVQRLGRTYTENIAVDHDGEPAAKEYVTGTGSSTGDHVPMAALWNSLASETPDVFHHSRGVYDSRQNEFSLDSVLLCGIAELNFVNETLDTRAATR